MRPLDIQRIGGELAIKWDDGAESYIPLETLRRSCPCAGCKGEMDILGNVYKNPDQPLAPTRLNWCGLAAWAAMPFSRSGPTAMSRAFFPSIICAAGKINGASGSAV